MRWLGVFGCCLWVTNAFAMEFNTDINLGGVFSEVSESSVNVDYGSSLYNFSDDLLKATENCTAYEENFTDNNPELKAYGLFMGGSDFKVLVKIDGKKDDTCPFKIKFYLGDMPMQNMVCSIDDATRHELLQAMKDRSGKHIADNFETKQSVENNNAHYSHHSVTNVSGTKFDVVFARVSAQNCTVTEAEPSDEEKKQAEVAIKEFPTSFRKSLLSCEPDSFDIMFLYSAQIKGWQKDVCQVSVLDFDLAIPQDKLLDLKNVDDLNNLLADKDIATYKPDYAKQADDLLFNLQHCSNKESGQGMRSRIEFEKITKTQDLSWKHDGKGCVLTFGNEVHIGQAVTNYDMNCQIDDAQLSALLNSYQDLLNNYGARQVNENGHIAYYGEQSNDETIEASHKLFNSLIEQGLCQ